MGIIFSDTDALTVAAMVAVAMAAGWLVGRWQGRRLRVELLPLGKIAVSKFVDASLAVLGLLLAFTFSMALSKYEQRRLMVVTDSNAIGDFYTCASLLKEPVRTKLRTVIHDYTVLRVDLAKRASDPAVFEHALNQFQRLHDQMVELVSQALADGTPIAVSLTNTLNNVTSSHSSRLAAVKDRVPTNIVVLLLLSAVIAAMLVGRAQGANDEADLAGTVCFIILISFAVYVTLDLNQPDRGFITVSQEPIARVLSTMSQ